ncbi:MAG: glycosyltransferase [Flavobacteriales bacterium]|nr:glycosyltransferase [Flavobacteriales bacterium]
MKLSVIIVNYNVRAYLEQCLRTVSEAMKGIDGDVFVVDNLSTDGSVEMVREKFPAVKLIANQENVGFSRANNQAIRESRAEYVVLLNPDTVVGEDVFRKVIAFMDAHPKAGGLGVKMIDGTGRFLPESKRGLPTPSVAFYKIIGLTRLFPRSKVFGRYHLGHLKENEAAPIEILSGACMFMRKRTLDEVGLLDESFFMYGEDIDLSYRIMLGGYENWYFPDARIIHYKGESTKKSSVNYVFVFYYAMAIFAKKHFTRKRPDLLAAVINASIYLSAAGAIVMRFLKRALLPMLDVVAIVTTILLVFGKLIPNKVGSLPPLAFASLLVLMCFALMGSYDLPTRLMNVFKGSALFAVTGFMLFMRERQVGDGLLDATMFIVFISVLVALAGASVRMVLHWLRIKPFTLRALDRKRILSIGSAEENRLALALLWQTHFGLGRQEQRSVAEAQGQLAEVEMQRQIRKQGMDEVVFCAKDMAWGRIIELMEKLSRTRATFKIAQPGSDFIIGPNSIESVQDLLVMEEHAIFSAAGRRRKRIVDVALSLLLILGLPILIWWVREKGAFLRNLGRVLVGRASWVGFHPDRHRSFKLPRMKPGVIDPIRAQGLPADPLTVDRVNITYAKDYQPWSDVRWTLRSLATLGH